MGLRISPLASGEHTLLSELGRSFKSSHTGIGAQELGFRLWASGEQTLLGIELCILFQVNSLRGSVHGIQDFASGRAASTHCSVNCVCSFRSIGVMGFGILPLGTRGSNTARH